MNRVGTKYRVNGRFGLRPHVLIVSQDNPNAIHRTEGNETVLPYAEAMALIQTLQNTMVTNLTACDHCGRRGAEAVEAEKPFNLCKWCMATFQKGNALTDYIRKLTFTLDPRTERVDIAEYITPEYDDCDDEETHCPCCGRIYEEV